MSPMESMPLMTFWLNSTSSRTASSGFIWMGNMEVSSLRPRGLRIAGRWSALPPGGRRRSLSAGLRTGLRRLRRLAARRRRRRLELAPQRPHIALHPAELDAQVVDVAVDLVDLLAAGQAHRLHELVEHLGLAPAVEQAGVDGPALDRGEAVGAEELVVGLLVVVHPQVEELAQGGDVLALLAHVDEPAHEGLHGVHVRVGELRLEGHRGPVHLHPGVEALEEWLGGLPRGADGRGGEETTEGDLVGVDEAGERLVQRRGAVSYTHL